MKKLISLLFLALLTTIAAAQISKTVDVPTAGTLRTLFTITEMTSVTNLTLTGSIDARDFKFMRDGITNLAVLDISAVTIQAYTGNDGTFTSTLYPANEIPQGSFNSKLKSVILPNSVISIGIEAFFGCGLISLTIPNSVTSIGYGAFSYCSGITSLTIPNSVTSIGNDAFNGCSRLTSLTIGNSVVSIGSEAFLNCHSLTSLTIPNSVVSIGNGAFEYCHSLTSLTIPNSVTSIGYYAFSGCGGLTSIYVYATTPIVLTSGTFASVNVYACTLYVPAGSKSAYQAAPIWEDFNIVEMTHAALPTLALESVNIYPNPVTDGFRIEGLDAMSNLILTDLGGKIVLTKQVMANEYVTLTSLPKGVYIARITTPKGIIEKKIIKD